MFAVRVVRAFVAWLFTAVFWLVLLTIHLVTFRLMSDERLASLIHFWGRTTLVLAGIPLEFVNESTVEGRDARVVIVNHQSALELIWGAVILPPGFLVIGKKEIVYVPVMNLIWWGLRLIRIDRKNHVKAIAALQGVAAEIVRKKRSLLLAPEGTRTRTGEIGPFKKGAFRIAADAGVPVYPVVVSGAYEVLPRGVLIPRSGRLRVRFLPPISLAEARAPDGGIREDFIEKVRADMIQAERELHSAF